MKNRGSSLLESNRRIWLVLHDGFNLLNDVRGQLLYYLHRLHIVLYLQHSNAPCMSALTTTPQLPLFPISAAQQLPHVCQLVLQFHGLYYDLDLAALLERVLQICQDIVSSHSLYFERCLHLTMPRTVGNAYVLLQTI